MLGILEPGGDELDWLREICLFIGGPFRASGTAGEKLFKWNVLGSKIKIIQHQFILT